MNWIDFQVIADEQGLESGFEIDDIVKTKDGFDVCYTNPDNDFQGVIEIREDED
jgi:hypothetical protein